MVCDICGKKGARVQRTARTYGKRENLLVIENVPVVVCPHCGESYLTSDTMLALERIRLHRRQFARKRPIAVAAYA